VVVPPAEIATEPQEITSSASSSSSSSSMAVVMTTVSVAATVKVEPQSSHPIEELVAMVDNPSFAQPQGKRIKKMSEADFYGFRIPQKIQRKMPLSLVNSDPCQCLHILDDMYAVYKENQVRVRCFHFFRSPLAAFSDVHPMWLCCCVCVLFLCRVAFPSDYPFTRIRRSRSR
jgi:hypothetical protein